MPKEDETRFSDDEVLQSACSAHGPLARLVVRPGEDLQGYASAAVYAFLNIATTFKETKGRMHSYHWLVTFPFVRSKRLLKDSARRTVTSTVPFCFSHPYWKRQIQLAGLRSGYSCRLFVSRGFQILTTQSPSCAQSCLISLNDYLCIGRVRFRLEPNPQPSHDCANLAKSESCCSNSQTGLQD